MASSADGAVLEGHGGGVEGVWGREGRVRRVRRERVVRGEGGVRRVGGQRGEGGDGGVGREGGGACGVDVGIHAGLERRSVRNHRPGHDQL